MSRPAISANWSRFCMMRSCNVVTRVEVTEDMRSNLRRRTMLRIGVTTSRPMSVVACGWLRRVASVPRRPRWVRWGSVVTSDADIT